MVGALLVKPDDEIMLISSSGTLVRTPVSDISVQGRNTQGVRLIRLDEGDRLVGLERIVADGEPKATRAAKAARAARAVEGGEPPRFRYRSMRMLSPSAASSHQSLVTSLMTCAFSISVPARPSCRRKFSNRRARNCSTGTARACR